MNSKNVMTNKINDKINMLVRFTLRKSKSRQCLEINNFGLVIISMNVKIKMHTLIEAEKIYLSSSCIFSYNY